MINEGIDARAHNEGFDAARYGEERSHNPYSPYYESRDYKSWSLGWDRYAKLREAETASFQREIEEVSAMKDDSFVTKAKRYVRDSKKGKFLLAVAVIILLGLIHQFLLV